MCRSSRAASRRVERIARLLEGGEGVGVHHLGPHVAVVARRIAVAGEDMGEMRRRVAHRDRPRHADPLEHLGLRAIGSAGGAPRGTPGRPAPRPVFHRGEALVEVARRLEPVAQASGIGSPSAMAGDGLSTSGTSSQCS
jgi:hypothetical protein